MSIKVLWRQMNREITRLEKRKKQLEALGDDPAALEELGQLEMLLQDSYETLDISGYYNPPVDGFPPDRQPPPIQQDAFPSELPRPSC